ncbi:putative elongator complex protein 1 isoform X2 [Dysidea avara]|uniref:putative elongator complex protein 1 isoform X2 n=1 Tax=Dysidea avara TaxID=196820 RepID=UPI0033197F76
MDNLQLVKQVVLPKTNLLSGVQCFAVDQLMGVIWIATNEAIYCTNVEDNEIKPIACLHKVSAEDTSAAQPADLAVDIFQVYGDGIALGAKIVHLESVAAIECVCIAANTGEVLLLHTSPHELECVGCCDDGINCMSWSPDQELVLFVTANYKLVLMTRDFDTLSEQAAHQTGFGEAEPINVGWGKKETQFHGSLGKAAAQSKEKEAGTALLADDGKPRVSWREDGQYFVCSTLNPDTGKRIVRVWSRELVLHSTAEPLDGLEHPLSWRPCGNLIASTQRRPHKHDIVFFERNGLQHGSFTLPFAQDEVKVQQLTWNTSSSVLGVWLDPLQPDRHDAYVQLWSISNYHWYLKMELKFLDGVAGLLWDPINQLKLHVITTAGQYISYDFKWGISQTEGSSPNNRAAVVLIDGSQLLYTPFRKCVIPPPMCSHELKLSSPANEVTFSPCLQRMLVSQSDGRVALFFISLDEQSSKDQHGFSQVVTCPKLVATTSLPLNGVVIHRHLTWYSESLLLGVVWDMTTQSDQLYEYQLTHSEDDYHIKVANVWSCEEPVLAVHSMNPSTTAIQLINGSILHYSPEAGLSPWMLHQGGRDLQLPEPCIHMRLAVFNDQTCVVSLSERGRLYVNTTQLSNNCSSFYVYDTFLLLTTHSHVCYCVSLHQDVSDLKLLQSDSIGNEYVRNVERGSRIVTAISHDTRVVLQMPRGNLETINPRALVLSHLRNLLDNQKFRESFVIMRKHRINMNLLYDHNPQLFLDNVTEVVQQLESVGGLSLFLTELSEQDVTITMYSGKPRQLSDGKVPNNEKDDSKVDVVCDAVLVCLDRLYSTQSHLLLPTITALVKKTTPQLETVLTKIKQLQAASSNGGIGVEEALKYSLLLVDVNQLYDVALGMYDFELVLLVAEMSQKDPKEYLPFLNQLRKMDTHYQRYSIDRHLQRYSKALSHLSKCSDDKFEEALLLIKTHHLYSLGIELYSDRTEQYKAIALEYGSYLAEKKQFREAMLMYRKAEQLSAALAACERWGCWQQAFTLSAELNQPPEEKTKLAHRTANTLRQKRLYKEAAQVLITYAHDLEEAIVVLLEGGAWEDALCLAHQNSRADIVLTHIEPAITEAQQTFMATLETVDRNFTQYSSRLYIVRATKAAHAALIADGEMVEEDKEDLFSETSSVTSLRSASGSTSVHSRTTAHSRKNRRKAEKKKYSLKEGSQYEDVALLIALGDIVTNISNMQNDVAQLLTILVQFNKDQLAKQLQSAFATLLGIVKSRIPSIWTPVDVQNTTSLTGPQSTANSIVTGLADEREQDSNKLPQAVTVVPAIPEVKWKLDFLT